MTTATTPDATEVYALGSNPGESARLQRQSDELRPQSAELLDRIGLGPGQSAIDLGCGPSGILELLSVAVFARRARGRAGRRPGAHRDGPPARQRARTGQRGGGDGRRQAHRPAVGQLRPGARPDCAGHDPRARRRCSPRWFGWPGRAAGSPARNPTSSIAFCYPPLPAWDRLREIFRASFGRSGADLLIGRRLTELYRQAGLEEIEVVVHAPVYPAGPLAPHDPARPGAQPAAHDPGARPVRRAEDSPSWTGPSASISPTRAP